LEGANWNLLGTDGWIWTSKESEEWQQDFLVVELETPQFPTLSPFEARGHLARLLIGLPAHLIDKSDISPS
jgi:hypothetical protein